MRPLTKEWIDKAESDYRTMRREHRVTEEPNFEGVCFHAQQCVEKLLKAFLHANHIRFPKTHDIEELFDLLLPIRPEWETLSKATSFLTRYAVDARYPGDPTFPEEADEAVIACQRVHDIIVDALSQLDQLRL